MKPGSPAILGFLSLSRWTRTPQEGLHHTNKHLAKNLTDSNQLSPSHFLAVWVVSPSSNFLYSTAASDPCKLCFFFLARLECPYRSLAATFLSAAAATFASCAAIKLFWKPFCYCCAFEQSTASAFIYLIWRCSGCGLCSTWICCISIGLLCGAWLSYLGSVFSGGDSWLCSGASVSCR